MTIVSNVCIYDLDKSIIAAGYPMSVDIESQQDRDLNENDFKQTINVTDDLGYLSGHTASYYDEYKEEGLVQITVDIHLHNIRQISESECDFLKSICTPIDEINLNPLFGILKVKDEFEN